VREENLPHSVSKRETSDEIVIIGTRRRESAGQTPDRHAVRGDPDRPGGLPRRSELWASKG